MDRRRFLSSVAGTGFYFLLPRHLNADDAVGDEGRQRLAAWVHIGVDNKVSISSPAAEMGQGSMTAIPMILAEELDLDWDDVIVVPSPVDDEIFHNPTSWIHGIMLTLGSSTVSGYYDRVRLYGAQIRKLLRSRAAAHWQVPLQEVLTSRGKLHHPGSNRSMYYAELADILDSQGPIPAVSRRDLKAVGDFRIIGTDLPRVDVPGKTDGSARYSIDIDLPNMLYASVRHSPQNGGRPLQIDNRAEVESMPAVVGVVILPDAVAVVARRYADALLAEERLLVRWSAVPSLDAYDDMEAEHVHLHLLNDGMREGKVIQKKGDARSVLATAVKRYQAEYLSDYLYHAQLEPLNAVAHLSEDGRKIEVWAGTQAPSHCVRSVAEEMGVGTQNVTLHRSFLGGGFGRRGAQDHDFVIDAVRLAKHMGAPVKAIWSRANDIRCGRFKPMKAIGMSAGEDGQGRLVAWHHRTVSDEALKQSDPYRYGKVRGWPVISSSGMETDYEIENVLAEILDPETGMRASPMRGIGGNINKFASESFLDEIAQVRQEDPLTLRLRLLQQHPVAVDVVEAVADMSAWWKRRPGEGMGVAFHSLGYPTACIVQVGLDLASGEIHVKKLWMAVDVGLAVHPQNIIRQLEGQVIYAISNALKERIRLKGGRVQQSNLDGYPLIRIHEIPEMTFRIITREGAGPLGVGDSRLEPVAAAIANATADLAGIRLRHLPFLPERVKAALQAKV